MRLLLIFLSLFSITFSEIGFIEPWGKDSQMVVDKNFILPLTKKSSLFAKLAEQIILFHQNVISPVDGPRSHFRPGSSQYMLDAIRQYGFTKGYIMGCDRLLRENKEEWVYHKKSLDGGVYKWDPVFSSANRRSSSKNPGGS